jgi:hypothetical protein
MATTPLAVEAGIFSPDEAREAEDWAPRGDQAAVIA